MRQISGRVDTTMSVSLRLERNTRWRGRRRTARRPALSLCQPEPASRRAAEMAALWYLPVFAVYLSIVGVTVGHHEPWLDEAQGWLIARDATWSDLLRTIPRYEGSPILWHLLLRLPARCGLPYASLG